MSEQKKEEQMGNKRKQLVALLVIISVLLFSSGVYFGSVLNPETERIVYVHEEVDIPSLIMYSAIGYVNETMWNTAWGVPVNGIPSVLQAIWTNDSYIAFMTFSNTNANECNITIQVDYNAVYLPTNTNLVGVKLQGYYESGAYFDINRYHINGTVVSENYLMVCMFLRGAPVINDVLVSSFLNVTLLV